MNQGGAWARWGARIPRHAATVCVVLAWVVACTPLWVHGFPHGQDASFELFRIAGYRNAFADRQWPPFWGGEFFVGYGSPIYLFYAPIFMSLASAFAAVTGSILAGAVWAAVVLLAVAAWATYHAAQSAFEQVTPRQRHQLACVAAIYYVLHPYLLADLYARNALAEFAALCLFPLVLWSVLRLRDASCAGRIRAVAAIGGVFALSVLAHNLSALVSAAFLLMTAMVLFAARSSAPGRRFGALAGGIALGLSLSAYFWVPALGYNDLTRTGIELREGTLDFHNNFVPFLSNFGLDAFFGTGPLLPIALAGGLVFGLLRPQRSGLGTRLSAALALFAVTLLLLQLPFTTPVWEHLPFLDLVSFPWRFLGQLGLVGALCLASLSSPVFGRLRERRWPWMQLGLLCLIGAQASIPLTRVKPLPQAVARDFDAAAAPEAIRNNPGAMATFRWEYIPRAADRDLWKADPHYRGAVHHTAGASIPMAIRMRRDRPREVVLEVDVPSPPPSEPAAAQAAVAIIFRRWMFPGWHARVDSLPVPVVRSPEGLVAVGVPVGAHHVVLRLAPPPLRAFALWWSVLAGLLLLWLGVRVLRLRTW